MERAKYLPKHMCKLKALQFDCRQGSSSAVWHAKEQHTS